MKKCVQCLVEKPFSEFYPRKWKTGVGYKSNCKDCSKRNAKKWAKDNVKRHSENTRRWWMENKEKHATCVSNWARANHQRRMKKLSEWQRANPERMKAKSARYRKSHPDRGNADKVKRKAKKLCATPKWANDFFIKEAYHLARLRTKVMGFPWHVDHIVPLRSKTVCGLHVENNLQVIPGIMNVKKNNRVWPDMP